jgi:GNAT superfamily N-acetyltransferase
VSLVEVAQGQIATVVTHLEMRKRPPLRPAPPCPLRLVHWATPKLPPYRALFRRVGEPWLWVSRLLLSDAELSAEINDPGVTIHAVLDPHGIEVGLLELDRRAMPDVEIRYFALVPELAGKGFGRWLMAHALAMAWSKGVERVWLHTCTLDAPGALGFYIKNGFTPVSRSIETFTDPRLTGLLPVTAAPRIPLLGPGTNIL